MPIARLQDLQVFQEALDAADAISAVLVRPPLGKDGTLRAQLGAASSAIAAQIAEGYGQLTDRHFAHYLSLSRGSCNEMQAHLAIARGRKYLTQSEWAELSERYDRLGRRLTRLIEHLRRQDRRDRG